MALPPSDWVAHYSKTRPDQRVLTSVDSDDTRTWLELERRVGALAYGLLNQVGLRKGDRIITLADSNIRFFELQFACMRAGLVLAPLNHRLTIPELLVQCETLSATAIVTDPAWEETAAKLARRAGIPRLITWGSGETSEFDAMASGTVRMLPRDDARADDVAIITFTSGTTGIPKGVTNTVGGMVWQAINQIEFARVAEESSHVLTPLPLFHGGGLNSLTNPIMFFGGQVSLISRFDPGACARYMGDPANDVTHIVLVPAMYQMMAESAEFQHGDFSRVRAMLVAGGRVSENLQAAYAVKGLSFTSQYGATETGPTVTALNPDRGDKFSAGSCGQKAQHVDVRLVDVNGEDSTEGEVWVRGPAITTHYYGRDQSLDFNDGWFRTGDVARVDDEGFYYIVGRIKEMYKSGGENVYPFEVEAVLGEHPEIAEVAIISQSDDHWGEVGLAIVVPKAGSSPTLESIRGFCDGRLARYKHPKAIQLIDQLPRSSSNKVAKNELRERFGGLKMS